MHNYLHDPQIIKGYYSEYLELINYYQDKIKRPSCFIKYYNINIDNSTYDEKIDASYDTYVHSDIKFDIFDLTPTYNVSPIINSIVNVTDLKGQMIDGSISIVTYTIARPRIDDIVTFYDPIKSNEIFRVSNFRLSSNALHSEPDITWYELELEYAPVANINTLNILNNYVYNINNKEYITYNDYKIFISNLTNIEVYLDKLIKYYDNKTDLYKSDEFIPLSVNEIIIHLKRLHVDMFEKYPSPYGYLELMNNLRYLTLSDIPIEKDYYIYNLNKKEIECYNNPELLKMFDLVYSILPYIL